VTRLTRFRDFWPHYLRAHARPGTRALHYAGTSLVVLLAAGQSVASAAPLTWDRTRSSVSTCADSDRQNAPGGGASYHLSVEIGGIASTQSKQILLY